jgi:hypothetical protein
MWLSTSLSLGGKPADLCSFRNLLTILRLSHDAWLSDMRATSLLLFLAALVGSEAFLPPTMSATQVKPGADASQKRPRREISIVGKVSVLERWSTLERVFSPCSRGCGSGGAQNEEERVLGRCWRPTGATWQRCL